MRAIMLSDGSTHSPLAGSRIVEVPDTVKGDDVDAAIKAVCEGDDEQAHGARVLYTATGCEPVPDIEQLDNATLDGLARDARSMMLQRAEGLVGRLVRRVINGEPPEVRVFRVDGVDEHDEVPALEGVTVEHEYATADGGKRVWARLLEIEALADDRDTGRAG